MMIWASGAGIGERRVISFGFTDMSSQEGIPIPTNPNGYGCAGCGETGRHAETCPSKVSGHILTDAGKRIIEQLVVEVADLRARVAALEAARKRKK
jgi:hypothetical protein